MVDFEDIHPPGGAVVERPFQAPGAEQQVERPRDLHEIVADVGSELLTAEDDARMPREEEEQVEVARVPQTRRFNELQSQGVGRLNLLDAEAPSREGPRPTGAIPCEKRMVMPEWGAAQGFISAYRFS